MRGSPRVEEKGADSNHLKDIIRKKRYSVAGRQNETNGGKKKQLIKKDAQEGNAQ